MQAKHEILIGSRAELNPWRSLCDLAKIKAGQVSGFFILQGGLAGNPIPKYLDL
jgi:hypothetical protein